MTKVVAYLSGVPSPHKSPHKIEVLQNYIKGVKACGDLGIAYQGSSLQDCDIAVIQGWVADPNSNQPHIQLRHKVARFQTDNQKHTIIIDSNLFNYKNNSHPTKYFRYSMDGIFPTTGNYFWSDPDPARWQQISRDLGIYLKDWRQKGRHILLCTQRNGGWSMKGKSVVDWLDETVEDIRKYTDRPIIVRGHPGDKNAINYIKPDPRYLISRNESILSDLRNAWAVVVYNSTPSVAASIEGIPAFILDPLPETSQSYGIANTDLSKIEKPDLPDRQGWIEKLSMCHWKASELIDGSAWQHMKKFI
jgi:hypothetical protein